MPRKLEIAWAAGLFEGEGSCSLTSGQRQPRVSLEMTDRDTVERFARIMGVGNVRMYGKAHQDVHQWSVQSQADVLTVLGLLWPFLGARRRDRAMEVIERATKMHDGAGFCKRGHDLNDPSHLYVHRKTGKRHCRTCRDARREALRLGN